MAALKAQDWQKEKEDDEFTEISKHLSLKFSRTLERFALGKEEDNEWIEKQWKKKILEDEEESAFGGKWSKWVREFALLWCTVVFFWRLWRWVPQHDFNLTVEEVIQLGSVTHWIARSPDFEGKRTNWDSTRVKCVFYLGRFSTVNFFWREIIYYLIRRSGSKRGLLIMNENTQSSCIFGKQSVTNIYI